jgi:hypothetical protein
MLANISSFLVPPHCHRPEATKSPTSTTITVADATANIVAIKSRCINHLLA